MANPTTQPTRRNFTDEEDDFLIIMAVGTTYTWPRIGDFFRSHPSFRAATGKDLSSRYDHYLNNAARKVALEIFLASENWDKDPAHEEFINKAVEILKQFPNRRRYKLPQDDESDGVELHHERGGEDDGPEGGDGGQNGNIENE